MSRPVIGITMGDPAGIGPEIAMKAILGDGLDGRCTPVIVGSMQLLQDVNRALSLGAALTPFEAAFNPKRPATGEIGVIDVANCAPEDVTYGEVSPTCGRAAAQYIEEGVQLALAGKLAAVVTGPIHKESLRQSGVPHPGHTEMLAHLTGAKDYAMMLVAGDLRVAHVTTHVPLKEVPDRVTKDRVLTVIRLAHEAVKAMGVDDPRVAVAGLNPHCGENGLFGAEDGTEIRPAVKAAQDEGIAAFGPLPGDTVFVKAKGGQFDVVVAMFHDQGHIPVKLSGFSVDPETGLWTAVTGINVTLGLPIIRTSVDHGVAFDIAGQGIANHQSMVDAVNLAVEMASGRAAQGSFKPLV